MQCVCHLPVGSRLSHIHLLSGGILPLLSLLENTLVRNADLLELSKETRSLRVVRVQLDDGRRLIGIRYPLPLISEVASLLKALQHAQQPGVKFFIENLLLSAIALSEMFSESICRKELRTQSPFLLLDPCRPNPSLSPLPSRRQPRI